MQQDAPLPYYGSGETQTPSACFFEPECGLFAVADAWGSQWDEAATRLAIEGVKRAARNIPDKLFKEERSLAGREKLLRWLTTVMNAVNFDLNDRSRADRRLSGIRCSMELLLLREEGAFLGHIGGGRSYLLRGKRLYQLTEDHTLANEAVARRQMSQEEAAAHPGRERLARALGPMPYIAPDTLYFELSPGDVFLLGTAALHRRIEWSTLKEWMRHPLEGLAGQLVQAACAGAEPPAPGLPAGVGCALVGVNEAGIGEAIIGSRLAQKALSGCPLFAELTPQELMRVQKMATVRRAEAGEFYVKEGEEHRSLLITLDGECSVWIDGQQIGVGGPSDPAGAIGLTAGISQVSNRAETPMLMLSLSAKALQALRTTDPRLASKLAYGALDRAIERSHDVARSLARYREAYGPTP